jgi:hypothetical protein
VFLLHISAMVCKNTQVVPSTTSIVYKKKEENSTSLSTLSTQNSTSFLCAQNTRATMSSIVRKICWCGEENHIDKCQIHGSQPFYHDEGGSVSNSWEIYRCERCEEVQDSFACDGHTPYDNYFETLPIRAMVVLANVLIQDSVSGKGTTGVSTPDDSFLLSSNKFEMNKVIIPKVESISYTKGYRTHLKKVANRVGQKDLFGEYV